MNKLLQNLKPERQKESHEVSVRNDPVDGPDRSHPSDPKNGRHWEEVFTIPVDPEVDPRDRHHQAADGLSPKGLLLAAITAHLETRRLATVVATPSLANVTTRSTGLNLGVAFS